MGRRMCVRVDCGSIVWCESFISGPEAVYMRFYGWLLCVGRIFLFWVCQSCCGGVEPLHLVNWYSHLGRNTIKYVVYLSANKEPVQNTSLQLYLSMCGLLLVRCWLQTKLSLKAGSQQQKAAVGWKQVSTKRNRSSCRMTNGGLIFSLTAMYFWNSMLAVDQVSRARGSWNSLSSRMIMSALKWRKGGKKKRMEIAVTWFTSDCSC